MLCCQFLCRVLNALFFMKIAQKLFFLPKNAKFARVGAPPPDPRASGGWGLRPHIPKTAPPFEFLATRLNMVSKRNHLLYYFSITIH